MDLDALKFELLSDLVWEMTLAAEQHDIDLYGLPSNSADLAAQLSKDVGRIMHTTVQPGKQGEQQTIEVRFEGRLNGWSVVSDRPRDVDPHAKILVIPRSVCMAPRLASVERIVGCFNDRILDAASAFLECFV